VSDRAAIIPSAIAATLARDVESELIARPSFPPRKTI